MEITTRLGIICPNCRKELEAKTKGLLGGLFTAQPLIHGVIKRIKKEGALITCGHCNHEWQYEPKRILKTQRNNKELDDFIDKLTKEVYEVQNNTNKRE